MANVALYRKYRSQTFGDLIGQGHVVRTIQNAIEQGKIFHSYLFTGPRGTGKTSSARLLAKALNCEAGPRAEPCNACEICRSITVGSCIDVVEMDAASDSGVDDVRDKIVAASEYRPMVARYKIFIVDEVHDLSGKAFDALLKTIEEPPEHVVFILATTEYNKVPATIRSRCQTFEFHRATMAHLVERVSFVAMQEGVALEPPAASAIARAADGGYRDALTLLEQSMLVADGPITLDLVYEQLGLVADAAVDGVLDALKHQDVPALLERLKETFEQGRDPRALLESLMYRLSDLTRAAYGVEIGAEIDSAVEASLHEAASHLGRELIVKYRISIAELYKSIRDVSLPRQWLEASLIRLMFAGDSVEQPLQNRAEPPPPAKKRPAPNGAWTAVYAELERIPAYRDKTLKVTASQPDPSTVVLRFDRELDCEWVQENPKRVRFLTELVLRHFPPGVERVELTFDRSRQTPAHAEAELELPAEGEKLATIGKEIFEGF